MRAAWYDRRGPAGAVLVVGVLPDPEPGPGEVRIRVTHSGISPGDVKKRAGEPGAPMAHPRVIPHSDGAGYVDALGAGVSDINLGQPVWVFGAQSYRPFGTAAEYTLVPEANVVALPDHADQALMAQTASLGIAGVTAHRAVFADGPVTGLTVLVHGPASGVGGIAAQLAITDGATVIGLVRRAGHLASVRNLGIPHVFTYDTPDLVPRIRAIAPHGVNRIVDVDLAGHIDLNAQLVAVGATISSYYSSQPRTTIPYWDLGFADTTIRLLGSDDFAPATKRTAAKHLTAELVAGRLHIPVAHRLPLSQIVSAHELVEHGQGRVVVLP